MNQKTSVSKETSESNKDTSILSVDIPLQPNQKIPSRNTLYVPLWSSHRLMLADDYRSFKSYIFLHIPGINLPSEGVFSIAITIYDNWFYKKGTLRIVDHHNLVKVIQDAVFERIGKGKDHFVFHDECRKVQSENRHIAITVSKIDMDIEQES